MPRGNGTATVSRWNSRPRSRTKRTARSRYRRRVGIPRFSTAETPRESLGKGFRIKNRKKIIVFFGDIKIIATFALAIEKIDASLAQLVEHDTLNVGVQGSSPWGGTKKNGNRRFPFFSLSASGTHAQSESSRATTATPSPTAFGKSYRKPIPETKSGHPLSEKRSGRSELPHPDTAP